MSKTQHLRIPREDGGFGIQSERKKAAATRIELYDVGIVLQMCSKKQRYGRARKSELGFDFPTALSPIKKPQSEGPAPGRCTDGG